MSALTNSLRPLRIIGAAAALSLAATACSPVPDEDETSVEGDIANETVAALLGDDDNFSAIAGVLNDTGVASAFDGAGAYTVLAPTNEALGALSDTAGPVVDEERRVLLIALLRHHILPGEVTPQSIRDAIESGGGPVEMRTLAGGTVTFSLDGDAIAVAGEGDRSAKLSGDALVGSNGAVIPVDAPLAELPASPGS